MVIFNSYVKLPEGKLNNELEHPLTNRVFSVSNFFVETLVTGANLPLRPEQRTGRTLAEGFLPRP